MKWSTSSTVLMAGLSSGVPSSLLRYSVYFFQDTALSSLLSSTENTADSLRLDTKCGLDNALELVESRNGCSGSISVRAIDGPKGEVVINGNDHACLSLRPGTMFRTVVVAVCDGECLARVKAKHLLITQDCTFSNRCKTAYGVFAGFSVLSGGESDGGGGGGGGGAGGMIFKIGGVVLGLAALVGVLLLGRKKCKCKWKCWGYNSPRRGGWHRRETSLDEFGGDGGSGVRKGPMTFSPFSIGGDGDGEEDDGVELGELHFGKGGESDNRDENGKVKGDEDEFDGYVPPSLAGSMSPQSMVEISGGGEEGTRL